MPKTWRRRGLAPTDYMLNLRIALKQGNFAELERHLNQGKTPGLQSLQTASWIVLS